MTDKLIKLNDEQEKPVLDTEGAVLVLAGAGSGKTRVLTTRIAYLVENKKVLPYNILAITFTNKAANEMRERLSGMIENTDGMWICTIHSMCVRILRMYADRIGYNKNFSIYSDSERASLLKQIVKRIVAENKEDDSDLDKLYKEVKGCVDKAKGENLTPDEFKKINYYNRNVDYIYRAFVEYQQGLKKNNALDFDDLLNLTNLLLNTNVEAREYLANKFQYIHVDEFQDTSEVQFNIVKRLASCHKNLFCVGDDDQSIYSWRGAKIENILNFEKYFSGAKVYKLEQNYRSTKQIIRLANAVIRNNGMRKRKQLWTENENGTEGCYFEADDEVQEAVYIVKAINELINNGYEFKDIAVLMRLNALSRSLESEFAKYSVPYKVFGGLKFYERKEIKDLLAYLRLINNPFDSEALIRIINVPKRGIGSRTIEEINNYANSNNLSAYDALIDVDNLNLNKPTKAKLTAFRKVISDLICDSQEMSLFNFVDSLVTKIDFETMYSEDNEENRNRLLNVQEFVNSVREFEELNPESNVQTFLESVTLDTEAESVDVNNFVTLATIHAVKGLEFKAVIICGVEEGILPSIRGGESTDEVEEERRLMYVAITRAREKIAFTRAKSRFMYGDRKPTLRSRFIKELDGILKLPVTQSYNSYDREYGNSVYGSKYGARNTDYGGNNINYGYKPSYGGKSGYGQDRYVQGDKNSKYNYEATPDYSESSNYSVASKPSYGGYKAPQSGGGYYNKNLSAFVSGTLVEHAKFGKGVILSTKNERDNLILTIKFDTVGIKMLSAEIAPLKIIK